MGNRRWNAWSVSSVECPGMRPDADLKPRGLRSCVWVVAWVLGQVSDTFARKPCLTLLLVAMLGTASGPVWAEPVAKPSGPARAKTPSAAGATTQPEVDDTRFEEKTLVGNIGYLGKRAISLEIERTDHASHEMYLPLGEHIEFVHVKQLADLKMGDRVKATYHQIYREEPDGQRAYLKSMVTQLEFLQPAMPNALSSGRSTQ